MHQFNNPQEEIEFLKSEIAKREKVIAESGGEAIRSEIVRSEITKYQEQPIDVTLSKGYKMLTPEIEMKTMAVKEVKNSESLNSGGKLPEDEATAIATLISTFEQRGLKNTLAIIEKTENPHLEDDFHRYLVRFFRDGNDMEAVKLDAVTKRSLSMALYEVLIPEVSIEEKDRKQLKEILSSMEQFFSGMLSVSDKSEKENYFSIEIANLHGSTEVVFYVAVPKSKAMLFEKQFHSIYPHAKLVEAVDDYNIFNPDGISLASYATSAKNSVYPLKTYEQFDYDPLNVILNTFSKLHKDAEGASIQFIVKPAGDSYIKRYTDVLKQVDKGVPLKKAIEAPDTMGGHLWKGIKDLVLPPEIKKKAQTEFTKLEQESLDQIKNKISSPIILANMRIVASAESRQRAEHILHEIESSFNQFTNTFGNALSFKHLDRGALKELERDYIFRNFNFDLRLPLNIKEVTSLMHFSNQNITSSRELKNAKAGTSPAPLNLPNQGVILGKNRDRGIETIVHMSPEDRMRHLYVIGQTGTGKSTLIKNMAIQDVQMGNGVCFIDPHGVDIQDILASVPEERFGDVIYFDPSYTPRPMGLNMLEYDRNHPEQKTFVVNEMLSIFEKLFDMKVAGGPMFEQYFRNATMLVIEDPDSGGTLMEISRVLADKKFRDMKISKCKNPIVVQFWKEVAEKAGGEASLANMVPYITSKFDVFLSNDIMRPIVAQEKSAFNFRELMDNKKILLVNLAKGKLGDINAYLIGLIIVGKILMAALSRVDLVGTNMADFYLYMDEFQNVTTPSISTILSEARKYRLSLNLAHQFIAQLDEKIRDSVFGNVGSIASFRVGSTDAEFLEKQFAPVFKASDLMNIDNRNAYIKMLVNGQPVKPFNIETLPPPPLNKNLLDKLKELSYLTYGVDREEIEAEIAKRFKKENPPPAPPLTPRPAGPSKLTLD